MGKPGSYRKCLIFFLLSLMNFLWLWPVPVARSDDSVCARVKIEIRQEMTLERQAFDAHMRIINGLSNIALENVTVNVNFTDGDGNSVLASSDPDNTNAIFFIRLDSMDNIDDVSGSGSVSPLNLRRYPLAYYSVPGGVRWNRAGETLLRWCYIELHRRW